MTPYETRGALPTGERRDILFKGVKEFHVPAGSREPVF